MTGSFTHPNYNRCPREAELHTPMPEGYADWEEWTQELLSQGYYQVRCPECNKFVIWEKRLPPKESSM
jgi:hypothetical protein